MYPRAQEAVRSANTGLLAGGDSSINSTTWSGVGKEKTTDQQEASAPRNKRRRMLHPQKEQQAYESNKLTSSLPQEQRTEKRDNSSLESFFVSSAPAQQEHQALAHSLATAFLPPALPQQIIMMHSPQQQHRHINLRKAGETRVAAHSKDEMNGRLLSGDSNDDGAYLRNRSNAHLPRQQHYYMMTVDTTPAPYGAVINNVMPYIMTLPTPRHLQHQQLVNQYTTTPSIRQRSADTTTTKVLLSPPEGTRGLPQRGYGTTAVMESLSLYPAGLQTTRTVANPSLIYYDTVAAGTSSGASSFPSAVFPTSFDPPSSSATLLHHPGREHNMTGGKEAIGEKALTYPGTKRVFKSFQERIQELADYKKHHGHCNVPRRRGSNKSLGIWCNNIRYSYKQIQEGQKPHNAISEEEIRELNKIGFQWCLRDDTKMIKDKEDTKTSNKKT